MVKFTLFVTHPHWQCYFRTNLNTNSSKNYQKTCWLFLNPLIANFWDQAIELFNFSFIKWIKYENRILSPNFQAKWKILKLLHGVKDRKRSTKIHFFYCKFLILINKILLFNIRKKGKLSNFICKFFFEITSYIRKLIEFFAFLI